MRTYTFSALWAMALTASATLAAQECPDPLADDSNLTLTYKVYQWNRETKNPRGYYQESRDEWVHALVADFESGYFADLFGFDFQAGLARDINSDDKFPGTNLPTGNHGNIDNHIAGLQQAYLKAAFSDENMDFYGTWGQKKRNLLSYSDSGTRILNASSFGVDTMTHIQGLNLYTTFINAFSPRNHSTFNNSLKNEHGQTIDDIFIVGAGYEWNGMGATVEQARSHDYLKKTITKMYYTLPVDDQISVDLDARFGQVEKDGHLYDTAFMKNGKYKSSYNNLNATVHVGNAYVGAGYNKTRKGDYDKRLFASDHGSFNSSLDLETAGYNYEGETAFLVKAGYDFADYLPGLTIDAWYAQGRDAKDFDNFSQKELGTKVSYRFPGQLEGLSLDYFHTAYRTHGDAHTGRNDALDGMYNANLNRIYLTYTYKMF